MRVLVTGSTGHIGANVCRALLENGHEVVALARETSDRRGLDGLDLQVVLGDILDARSIREAMTGVDAVLHLAARFATRGATVEEIRAPAIEGTRVVLEAARDAGVERVVYTGSAGAAGYETEPGRLRTHEDWHEHSAVPYFEAKRDAELLAWALADELALDMVAVLPAPTIGQHAYRITPSLRIIRGMVEGSIPSAQGGTALSDVRDVADMHVAALERGQSGARYIVSGENVTLRELGRQLQEVSGCRILHAPLPRFLIPVAMPVFGAVYGMLGKDTMTVEEAREFLGHYAWFDTSKAVKELGFSPRPLRETLSHTVAWLVHRKALSAGRMRRLEAGFPPEPGWVRSE